MKLKLQNGLLSRPIRYGQLFEFYDYKNI